ncbi:MAG: hypothetical protein C0498_06885 [Anaerolinea sp.]|nr:hypothetical protein [Anaerolinea sp.]
MLAVLRTQPAVEWTAALDLGGDPGGRLSRLVELRLLDVGPSVRVDQTLEPAVIRAALAQEDLALSEQHLGVDRDSADRADRSRDLVEDRSVRAGD